MDMIKATEIAQALYNAHGDKAEWEAAQLEKQFKNEGNEDEAENWRSIRGRIRRIRGPNQA